MVSIKPVARFASGPFLAEVRRVTEAGSEGAKPDCARPLRWRRARPRRLRGRGGNPNAPTGAGLSAASSEPSKPVVDLGKRPTDEAGTGQVCGRSQANTNSIIANLRNAGAMEAVQSSRGATSTRAAAEHTAGRH
jgi:hypothetical protein